MWNSTETTTPYTYVEYNLNIYVIQESFTLLNNTVLYILYIDTYKNYIFTSTENKQIYNVGETLL